MYSLHSQPYSVCWLTGICIVSAVLCVLATNCQASLFLLLLWLACFFGSLCSGCLFFTAVVGSEERNVGSQLWCCWCGCIWPRHCQCGFVAGAEERNGGSQWLCCSSGLVDVGHGMAGVSWLLVL